MSVGGSRGHALASYGRALAIKPASRANADINVTPLVDVVLVLLIIFMVVTPLLEKDINVQIPTEEKADEPQEVPPDQLVLNIAADGAVTLNGTAVDPTTLVDTLRGRLGGRAQRIVFITADDRAPYRVLVAVLDGARRAGADMLGMTATAEPPG